MMKTFKMYVKTVIYNEQDKILLLNKKSEDDKPSWDLPGATFTEEQSFDETIINNVQKEIGFYVYPGKIIGISDYSSKEEKEVNVIMEGTILNGDLLLSKDYETYIWVHLSRITDYPLAPWLNDYIHHNKNPFKDVESEIEEITTRTSRRRNIFHNDKRNNNDSENNSEERRSSVKSSFGLLKDTIIRTFHPQEAKVSQTQPKTNKIYQEDTENEDNEKESFVNKLNFKFKRDQNEEYIEKTILNDNDGDIIVEHDDKDIIIDSTEDSIVNKTDDIIIDKTDDIIIDKTDDIIIDKTDDIIIDNKDDIIINQRDVADYTIPKKEKPVETIPTKKKIFDMNVNKQQNMKNSMNKNMKKSVNKIKKVIRENKSKPNKEPEIKIIHKNEQRPLIRKEKESTERFSFNSENIKRNGWKERLNKINRTDANNQKKEVPRPKGQRK